MRIAENGIIIVMITITKRAFLNGNFILANAYPAMESMRTLISVTDAATTSVFSTQRRNGVVRSTSRALAQQSHLDEAEGQDYEEQQHGHRCAKSRPVEEEQSVVDVPDKSRGCVSRSTICHHIHRVKNLENENRREHDRKQENSPHQRQSYEAEALHGVGPVQVGRLVELARHSNQRRQEVERPEAHRSPNFHRGNRRQRQCSAAKPDLLLCADQAQE